MCVYEYTQTVVTIIFFTCIRMYFIAVDRGKYLFFSKSWLQILSDSSQLLKSRSLLHWWGDALADF